MKTKSRKTFFIYWCLQNLQQCKYIGCSQTGSNLFYLAWEYSNELDFKRSPVSCSTPLQFCNRVLVTDTLCGLNRAVVTVPFLYDGSIKCFDVFWMNVQMASNRGINRFVILLKAFVHVKAYESIWAKMMVYESIWM